MNHTHYMQRCLHLAKLGAGTVAPNPMVGCVIVDEDKIVGEGWHQEFGKAHAEVNAINAVAEPSVLSQSTLYVNLEPCSHYGKTPPCVDLILQHRIPKVVIGITDSFAAVNGEGIRILKAAGMEVIIPVLEMECREINKRFFNFYQRKRPTIILKWAQSKDGYIGKINEQVFVSNQLSQLMVHKWRSEEQSIMVGTNTALIDNPKLTVREWFGNSPVRIVIDKDLKLPTNLHLMNRSEPTIVFTVNQKPSNEKIKYVQLSEDDFTISSMLNSLFQLNIQSVLVEGGATLLQSFIDTNCWDEARVISGTVVLQNGIEAPRLTLAPFATQRMGDDAINFYRNPNAI